MQLVAYYCVLDHQSLTLNVAEQQLSALHQHHHGHGDDGFGHRINAEDAVDLDTQIDKFIKVSADFGVALMIVPTGICFAAISKALMKRYVPFLEHAQMVMQ